MEPQTFNELLAAINAAREGLLHRNQKVLRAIEQEIAATEQRHAGHAREYSNL